MQFLQLRLEKQSLTVWINSACKCPTCLSGQTSKQLPSTLLRVGLQLLSLPLNTKEKSCVRKLLGVDQHWRRKEYATVLESAECARLDMVMAQGQARLAREQAEAEAAIAADDRAVQPTRTATATATTDIPCMLSLQSISTMSTLPAAEAMRNHDIWVHNRGKGLIQVEERCSEETVLLLWREWQYGGEYASVKSLLCEE